MDIGPVSASRPVTMIRPSPAAPDLSRVGETENRGHSGDDDYTSNDKKAARGLEDEENETTPEDSAAAASRPHPAGSVSFFA
jgi:hypothetical protein